MHKSCIIAVLYAKSVSTIRPGNSREVCVIDSTSLKSRLQIFTEEDKRHHSFIDTDYLFHPEMFGYKVAQLKFGKIL